MGSDLLLDATDETVGSKRTSGLVMHHTGKVLDTKLGFVAVFRRDVVGVEFVLRVELIQHRSISSLTKTKKKASVIKKS